MQQQIATSGLTAPNLQMEVLKAHFGNKVKCSGSFEEFKESFKAKWTNRDLVTKLGEFITANSAEGTAIPYGKDERLKTYWTTLRGLR